MGSTTGRGSSDPRCLDRDIPRDHRAYTGAFFTPRLWVDEAHREMDRVLGPNWRRDCVVWDCAAGTGNLTRDKHDWGCLISSTAERPDVGAMRDHGWGGHHVFQYDFLNPDAESPFFEDGVANVVPASVDRALREAAKAGKRLVWFMNPPYGTAASATKGASKKGVGATATGEVMKTNEVGAASGQLYAQFMFQCRKVAEQYGFKDYTVALFSVPTFMSSGSYRPFRDWWYGAHEYRGGFLFQASHFADVSGRWGVSFTVWSAGSGSKTDTCKEQPLRLCDESNFAVVTNGTKQVYNADGREASSWVRALVKGLKGVDAPQMSSGLKVTESKYGGAKQQALIYCNSLGNNLAESATGVYFLSCASSRGHDFTVLPSNWRRAVALYGARKLVEENWVNQKDEYLAPDEHALGYDQWVDDLHVYALLHASNNCTAMRDVEYKGKSWRIKNHFFWRTRAEMIDLLDAPETPQLYRDARMEPLDKSTAWGATGDAYLAHLLATGLRDRLSPDVRALLDTLDQLMVDSMRHRENFAAGREDLHLTSWDAGVYQLKTLWQATDATRYKALRAAFHACAARLKSGTFEYGFLRR